MNKITFSRGLALMVSLSLLPALVQAHEGHGLTGAHWHATDAWGLAVGSLVALAVWLSRGSK